MRTIHVIGPVIRTPKDDRNIKTSQGSEAVSSIYKGLAADSRFQTLLPEGDPNLDEASPEIFFEAMQKRINDCDGVVWVYHEEPAGAVEAGLAAQAGKRIFILAESAELPRIIRGIPNVRIVRDVAALRTAIAREEREYLSY